MWIRKKYKLNDEELLALLYKCMEEQRNNDDDLSLYNMWFDIRIKLERAYNMTVYELEDNVNDIKR